MFERIYIYTIHRDLSLQFIGVGISAITAPIKLECCHKFVLFQTEKRKTFSKNFSLNASIFSSILYLTGTKCKSKKMHRSNGKCQEIHSERAKHCYVQRKENPFSNGNQIQTSNFSKKHKLNRLE